MMIAIIAIVTLKNVFVWLAGQLGASLQENVTRDLRDGVFRHLQRLPLGYFQRTKTGQIISRVLSDTEQTKALITELVTRTLQNLAQIVGTIVILLSYSVRLTFVALVDRAAAHPRAAAGAAEAAQGPSPAARRLRRDHERAAGSGERRPAREVVPRRAVRGRALHATRATATRRGWCASRASPRSRSR